MGETVVPNTITPDISRMGREKRTIKADEFASNTYQIIKKLKAAEKITSFNDTAEMLNSKKIPTPNGGKWRVNTLQSLYKRCEKLGILD